jgi:solute carrier family 25 (adenine nucleotide translocator) protein 4/5/6/31
MVFFMSEFVSGESKPFVAPAPAEQNMFVSLAAGGISGAVSKTVTAPIEKVKLALQNQDSNPAIISGEIKRYTGMADCFTRHVTELGASSLWRGNFANCVRYVPTAAFNLMFKDTMKSLFPKYDKKKEFAKFAGTQVASGSFAGAMTNTLVYPLIYVRTILGADIGKVKQFNGMGDALMKTVQKNGFFSLYNGIGPSTAGIVVYRGAQFGLQDILKSFNPWQKEVSVIGLVSKFTVANIAVAFSGIAAYPLETMQRRLQIEATKPPDQQLYNGTVDCFQKILKNEGFGGFMKGSTANVFRGVGAALVLVMYDEIMNAIYG